MVSFTECGLRYTSDPTLIARYNYSGPVKLIPSNPDTQITYKGCKALCGTGNEWCPWIVTANTITTWWLLQAHLSTEDYHNAATGLWRVRRFRRFSFWIRIPSALIVMFVNNALSACRIRKTSERRVLVWANESQYTPKVGRSIMQLATGVQVYSFGEPLAGPFPSSHPITQGSTEEKSGNAIIERTGGRYADGRRGVDRALLARSLNGYGGGPSEKEIKDCSLALESSRNKEARDEEKGRVD